MRNRNISSTHSAHNSSESNITNDLAPSKENAGLISEAQRLLDKGYHLVELKPYTKQPIGLNWNHPSKRVKKLNLDATGYGIPLKINGLCSLDPDNGELARVGFEAWGLSMTFDELLNAGVRTASTRPGSGGRSTFLADEKLRWLKFRTRKTGTILELRANAENLQDCIPGTEYLGSDDSDSYLQSYTGNQCLDDADALPTEFREWWIKLSSDLSELRKAQELFYTAIAKHLNLSVSELGGFLEISDGKQMAYNVPGLSAQFNRDHSVEAFLLEYGYKQHGDRYAAPNSTGAPGIRLIPNKEDLWQSDHASDPLSGTFDAWSCYVVLKHRGDLQLATAEYEAEIARKALADFVCLSGGLNRYEMSDQPKATKFIVQGLVAEGVTVLASYPGGGKTSAVLALATHVCGGALSDIDLQPIEVIKHRHVIYFTEHPEQVELILNGMIIQGWADQQLVRDRIHIIPARRKPHEALAELANEIRSEFYRNKVCRNGVEIDVTPWVVFDTTSAMIDLENENSNSDWSAAISALKEAYRDIPLTLIAHTSKMGKNASNASSLTTRGGSALEGDANQIMFLTVEEKNRYIDIADSKHRFTPVAHSISIRSELVNMTVVNEFNEKVKESVVVCQLEPLDFAERKSRKEDAENEKLMDAIEDYQDKIAELVNPANVGQTLLSKTDFKKLITDLKIPNFSKSEKASKFVEEILKLNLFTQIESGSPEHQILKSEGFTGAPQAKSYVVTTSFLRRVNNARALDPDR